MSAIRAVLFDFNGTLSHDEELWFEVYRDLFAELGLSLTRREYFEEFVGLGDADLIRSRVGGDRPELVEEAVARFRRLAAERVTVSQAAREAVRAAAELVPVGVVSTARRDLLDELIDSAGLGGVFSVLVGADDVERTKPDPEGYLRALGELGAGVQAGEVLVFEDTAVGVAAAKAAGMRCVAVLGTVPRESLAAADEIVDALDAQVVRRLLA